MEQVDDSHLLQIVHDYNHECYKVTLTKIYKISIMLQE